MRFTLSTALPIFFFFGPTVLGILLNQVDPNTGTAMGVPYFALLSILLGLLSSAVVALLSWRQMVAAPNAWVIIGALVISIGVFAIANSGSLSRIS